MRTADRVALVFAVAIGVFLTCVQFNVLGPKAMAQVHRGMPAHEDRWGGLDHGLVSFSDDDASEPAAAAPSTGDSIAESLAAVATNACDCCSECPGVAECCCEGAMSYCSAGVTDTCVLCDEADVIP